MESQLESEDRMRHEVEVTFTLLLSPWLMQNQNIIILRNVKIYVEQY
jgi:chemotaxis methyl-accepting protein methylase